SRCCTSASTARQSSPVLESGGSRSRRTLFLGWGRCRRWTLCIPSPKTRKSRTPRPPRSTSCARPAIIWDKSLRIDKRRSRTGNMSGGS
ncbi:unnamed protein product, partial [Durusdinium trenchii]